jgi:hypothetical protein
VASRTASLPYKFSNIPKPPKITLDLVGIERWKCFCFVAPLLRASFLELAPVGGTSSGGVKVAMASFLHAVGPLVRDLQRLATARWVITHKYRGSQQFSRVEYSTQIYRFDTREAKEYL